MPGATSLVGERAPLSTTVLSTQLWSLPPPGAACAYPPSVLDFLPLRGVDAGTVEETWPCEVRVYWVRDLHPFVSFVRFIYAYFTLFVVATGKLDFFKKRNKHNQHLIVRDNA